MGMKNGVPDRWWLDANRIKLSNEIFAEIESFLESTTMGNETCIDLLDSPVYKKLKKKYTDNNKKRGNKNGIN